MKKIMKKMASLAACAAVALGLAGCDGGMHDVKASPLGLLGIAADGDLNYAILMDMDSEDGSEQSLSFKWSSDYLLKATNGKDFGIQDGWGKNDGNLSIAIAIPSSVTSGENAISDWTGVRRGDDNSIYLTIGDNEFTPLLSSSLAFPGNIVISGLIDGEEYTLYAKYDSSAESVSVRIDGKSSDPTQFRIIAKDEDSANFPAKVEVKDENGNAVEDDEGNIQYEYPIYGMSKAGNDYTYQFFAAADEEIIFSIENDLLGTMATDSTLPVKKDHEYKITFTKKAGATGSYKSEEISFFKNAEFFTNTQHNYDFYNEELFAWLIPNKTLLFKAPATSFELKVIRVAGSDTKVWAKKDANITAKDTPIVLKYIDTEQNKDVVITPISISGLTKDQYYWLEVDVNQDDLSLTATLKDAERQKPEEMQGSAGTYDLVYNESNISEVTLNLNDSYADGWNNQNKKTISFALLAEKGTWDPIGTVYKNAEITLDGEAVLIPPSNSGGNNTINSDEDFAGRKVKITITSGFDGVSVKAESVE